MAVWSPLVVASPSLSPASPAAATERRLPAGEVQLRGSVGVRDHSTEKNNVENT